MRKRKVIRLLFGIILIFSLVACSSPMENFTSSFEEGDYKEALNIYVIIIT